MRWKLITGILLIVLGTGALAAEGITYTSEEAVIDIGPLEATAETKETLPIPPVVGVATVLAGLGLVVLEFRKR